MNTTQFKDSDALAYTNDTDNNTSKITITNYEQNCTNEGKVILSGSSDVNRTLESNDTIPLSKITSLSYTFDAQNCNGHTAKFTLTSIDIVSNSYNYELLSGAVEVNASGTTITWNKGSKTNYTSAEDYNSINYVDFDVAFDINTTQYRLAMKGDVNRTGKAYVGDLSKYLEFKFTDLNDTSKAKYTFTGSDGVNDYNSTQLSELINN
jgi:hypothetical protein